MLGADTREQTEWAAARVPEHILASFIIEEVTHRPKSVIWMTGDLIPNPCFIKSGWGLRYNLLVDGRRQIYAFPTIGELLSPSLLISPVAPCCFQSITTTTLALLDRKKLVHAMRAKTPVFEAIARYFAALESEINFHLMEIGRMTAMERIASFLVRQVAKLQSVALPQHKYELPLTRGMVSDALGLTPIHVTRILKAMEHDGLLSWRRGVLEICDFERLLHLAPAAMHRRHAMNSN
jgi:CRP-like cAMP-binding protein